VKCSVENEMKGQFTKIVVVGGTGLIGSKLVPKLREHGHETLAASPNSGVNSVTGEGLAETLKSASVVVDVTNSPSWEDAAVMKFFETSTRNFLSHEATAGVGIMLHCQSLERNACSPAVSSAQKWLRRI
jgi:uncharacterized protein YbjT (DUF2867 family)